MIVVLSKVSHLCLAQKAPKLAWTRKLRYKKCSDFSWFSLIISFLENILLRHVEQLKFIFTRAFIRHQEKGAAPSN